MSSVLSLLWQLWASHATFVNLAGSLSSTLRAPETQFCASPEVRLGFQPWVGFSVNPGLRPDLVDEIHLDHLKAPQKVTEASVLYFIYACTYTCTLRANHCVPGAILPLVPIWGRRGEKKENEENLALAIGFDPEMSNYFSIPYAQNRENYARTKSCGTNDQAQMTPFGFTAYPLIWGTDTNFQQAMHSCLMPPSPSSYLLLNARESLPCSAWCERNSFNKVFSPVLLVHGVKEN